MERPKAKALGYLEAKATPGSKSHTWKQKQHLEAKANT
jgi:hypothetical protein